MRTRLMEQMSRLLKLAIFQQKHQIKDPHFSEIMARGQEELSRRRFLRQAGLSGIAIPTAFACQTPISELKTRGSLRDVIIIGAGTAGLTAAYHLAKEGIASTVYEASSRAGGRILTAEKFNADNMFCELGGEFVDTQHVDLIKLCDELGLVVEDLTVDDRYPVHEIYFSHNRLRSAQDIIAAFKPLADALIRDKSALMMDGELEMPSYNSPLARSPLVQALDRMSLSEYLSRAKLDSWLLDLISNAYVGEYGLETAEQSALNLILLIESDTKNGFQIFGESDEAKRIQGGNEALPKALRKALAGKVPIEYEHRLLAIQDKGTYFNLAFDHAGKTVEVSGRRVIVAVPAPILKEIDFATLDLSPVKRQAIAEWGFGTNSKLILGFAQRIWEQPDSRRGLSVLPDRYAQEFWDTSLGQKGNRGILTCFLGGDTARIIAPSLQLQSLNFLEQLFPGTQSAFDGNRMLMHWASQRHSKGSYTCPKPGQYTRIYGAFAEAELNQRLVFAGEHCSRDWSGYMNGAVQSGKQAVDLLLGREIR